MRRGESSGESTAAATDVEMTHKLFANINANPFLLGSVGLEGNAHKRTAPYLAKFMRSYYGEKPGLLGSGVDQDVLWKRFIDDAKETIEPLSSREDIEEFGRRIMQSVGELREGQSLLIPGGWRCNDSAHAMVYEVEKQASGNILFKIYNSGSGIEYHKSKATLQGKLSNPLMVYEIPAEHDTGEFKRIILQLRSAFDLRHTAGKSFPSYLYDHIFPQFRYLGGEINDDSRVDDQSWYTSGQLSGVCAQLSLHKLLKVKSETLDEYRKFIFSFKMHSIEDYFKTFFRENRDVDKRDLYLFKKAVTQCNRMLLLKKEVATSGDQPLFEPEERGGWKRSFSRYYMAIASYEEKFENAQLNNKGGIVKAPFVKGNDQFDAVVRNVFGRRQVVDPEEKPSQDGQKREAASPGQHTDPLLVDSTHGGAVEYKPGKGDGEVLGELYRLLGQCQQDNASGKYLEVIENIQSFIGELPLPGSLSDNLMDPYSQFSIGQHIQFIAQLSRLNSLCNEAYANLLGSDVVLPEMCLQNLTVIGIFAHFDESIHAATPGSSYHSHFCRNEVSGFLKARHSSVYLNCENPNYDNRMESIKRLYADDCGATDDANKPSGEMSQVDFFNRALLEADQALCEKLNELYDEHYPDGALKKTNYKALYFFLYHVLDQPVGEEKADFVEDIATCMRVKKAFKTEDFGCQFRDMALQIELKKQLMLGMNGHHVVMDRSPNIELIKLKGGVKLICGGSEEVLNLAHYRKLEKSIYQMERSGKSLHYDLALEQILTSRAVDHSDNSIQIRIVRFGDSDRVLFYRELQHLKTDQSAQLHLTLDYFLTNVDKLDDRNTLVYLEGSLLQSGLLLRLSEDTRESSLEEFLSKLDRLACSCRQYYQKDDNDTEVYARFTGIQRKVILYLSQIESAEPLSIECLSTLYDNLSSACETADNCQTLALLHRQRFSVALSLYESESVEDSVRPALWESVVESYVQCRTYSGSVDAKNRYDFCQIEKRFNDILKGRPNKINEETVFKLLRSLNYIEGPASSATYDVTVEGDLVTVASTASSEILLQIDLTCGAIFDPDGLAIRNLPQPIKAHPMFKQLGLQGVQRAKFSGNPECYYLESKGISIHLDQQGGVRFIKKGVLVDGVERDFELVAQSDAIATAFNIKPKVRWRELASCEILNQHGVFMWLASDGNSIHIHDSTSNELLCVGKKEPTERKWRFASAKREDLKLCQLDDSDFNRIIANFEDPRFVISYQGADEIQFHLSRYGIVLKHDKASGEIVYQSHGREYSLSHNSSIEPGFQSMTFRCKKDGSTICLLPIQPLMGTGKKRSDGIYYQFKLDTNNNQFDQHNKSEKAIRYSDTERYYSFKVEDGKLTPESSSEALYLAYIYLGTHQISKAWQMLEICEKNFGGIKGNADEIKFLNMMFKDFPCELDGVDDTTPVYPAMVSCQLKVLALYAAGQCEKRLVPGDGDNTLEDYDEIVSAKYIMYQRMVKSLESKYYLTDSELYNSLNQYFRMDRVEGDLGVEFARLKRNRMLIEYGDLFGQEQKRRSELEEQYKAYSSVPVKQNRQSEIQIDTHIPEGILSGLTRKSAGEEKNRVFSHAVKLKAALAKCGGLGGDGAKQTDEDDEDENIADLINALKAPFDQPDRVYDNIDKYVELAITLSHQEVGYLKHVCETSLVVSRHRDLSAQDAHVPLICNVLLRLIDNRDKIYTDSGFQSELEKIVDFKQLVVFSATLKDPRIRVSTVDPLPGDFRSAAASIGEDSSALEGVDNTVEVDDGFRDEIADLKNAIVAGLVDDDAFKQFKKDWYKLSVLFDPENNPNEAHIQESADEDLSIGAVESQEATDGGLLAGDSGGEESAVPNQGKQTKHQLLMHMKKVASEGFDDEYLGTFKTRMADTIKQLDTNLKQQEKRMLSLANSGPDGEEGSLERLQWQGELMAGLRDPLDMRDLLVLYAGNNIQSYRNQCCLSDANITELHKGLIRYATLKQAHQRLTRAGKQIDEVEKARGNDKGREKLKLARVLFARNLVDATDQPDVTLYQMDEDILIRPMQHAALNRLLMKAPGGDGSSANTIERIIMGGGKSKVILPTLASQKADGYHLVMIEVPPSLLATNFSDLRKTSATMFDQNATLFQFNRDSDSSALALKKMYQMMTDISFNKGYLVTTADSLQSVELKYIELLSMPVDFETQDASLGEWRQQVFWAEKLVGLMRDRGELIIDEVHQGLSIKNKLNYTIGDTEFLDARHIQQNLALYKFLKKVEYDFTPPGVVSDAVADSEGGAAKVDGIIKPLSAIVKDNDLIANEEVCKSIFDYFCHQLIVNPESPIADIVKQCPEAQREELQKYLRGISSEVPLFVDHDLNDLGREKLALYKHQISSLLPYTLQRNCLEHYGPSHLTSMPSHQRALAIPYSANNTPNERSRFGDYLETMNFTTQSLLKNGLSRDLLYSFLTTVMTDARHELIMGSASSIAETKSMRRFSQLISGVKLTNAWDLSCVDLDDRQQFDVLFEDLRYQDDLIFHVLETQVLCHIKVEPTILHSDSFNHADLAKSCHGLSGTVPNHSTFHQKFSFDPSFSQGIDGLIFNSIQAKESSVIAVDYTDVKSTIASLLDNYDKHKPLRAFVDINATFQGVDNGDLAEATSNYLQKHPQSFVDGRKPLKYVLYYNQANQLAALRVTDDEPRESIVLSGSDEDEISLRLDCTPDERFTIYDQARTVGTDIKQSDDACALVFVDDKTKASSFYQGVMRMRGLIESDQKVDMVVPTRLRGTPLESLRDNMANFELDQIKHDNYIAAVESLKNTLRNHVITHLLLATDDLQDKHTIMQVFESVFFDHDTDGFFAKYGGVEQTDTTENLLMVLAESLQQSFEAGCKSLRISKAEAKPANLKTDMDEIIAAACADGVCEVDQSFSTASHGGEVEVQQHVQNEVQQHVQKEVNAQVYDETLNWLPYTPLFSEESLHHKGPGLLQLQAVFMRSVDRSPTFTPNIVVSENFYRNYYHQKNYLDAYLKPVHQLLITPDGNGVRCRILSQQEAVELKAKPDFVSDHLHGCIVDTQSTFLHGDKSFYDTHLGTPEYKAILTQVQFFNGETQSIDVLSSSFDFLMPDVEANLELFEQHLLRNHETRLDSYLQFKSGLLEKLHLLHQAKTDPDFELVSKGDLQQKYPGSSEEAIDTFLGRLESLKSQSASVVQNSASLASSVASPVGSESSPGLLLDPFYDETMVVKRPITDKELADLFDQLGCPGGPSVEDLLKLSNDYLEGLTDGADVSADLMGKVLSVLSDEECDDGTVLGFLNKVLDTGVDAYAFCASFKRANNDVFDIPSLFRFALDEDGCDCPQDYVDALKRLVGLNAIVVSGEPHDVDANFEMLFTRVPELLLEGDGLVGLCDRNADVLACAKKHCLLSAIELVREGAGSDSAALKELDGLKHAIDGGDVDCTCDIVAQVEKIASSLGGCNDKVQALLEKYTRIDKCMNRKQGGAPPAKSTGLGQ